MGSGIYRTHLLHLFVPLSRVPLVNTDGIDPEFATRVFAFGNLQERIQVVSYHEGTLVDGYRVRSVAVMFFPPYIGEAGVFV